MVKTTFLKYLMTKTSLELDTVVLKTSLDLCLAKMTSLVLCLMKMISLGLYVVKISSLELCLVKREKGGAGNISMEDLETFSDESSG